MDSLDRTLLDRVQQDFPLDAQPYAVLSEDLGASADELLERLRASIERGLVRTVCAVFEPKKIGHVSGLAAMQVPEADLERIAAIVGEYPDVTHNYERIHAYSLWFALVSHGQKRLDEVLAAVEQTSGVEVHHLPMIRRFKIRVNFSLAEDNAVEPRIVYPQQTAEPVEIIPRLVRELCRPLPLVLTPFAEIAGRIGMAEADVVNAIRSYRNTGVMRRLGAMLRHKQAGFSANAMTVYAVGPDAVEEVGLFASEFAEVSHCYERPPLGDFPYNLYAMVHGHTMQECDDVRAKIAEHAAVEASTALVSGREFKKASPVYFPCV